MDQVGAAQARAHEHAPATKALATEPAPAAARLPLRRQPRTRARRSCPRRARSKCSKARAHPLTTTWRSDDVARWRSACRRRTPAAKAKGCPPALPCRSCAGAAPCSPALVPAAHAAAARHSSAATPRQRQAGRRRQQESMRGHSHGSAARCNSPRYVAAARRAVHTLPERRRAAAVRVTGHTDSREGWRAAVLKSRFFQQLDCVRPKEHQRASLNRGRWSAATLSDRVQTRAPTAPGQQGCVSLQPTDAPAA
jgi:hypothetical protein